VEQLHVIMVFAIDEGHGSDGLRGLVVGLAQSTVSRGNPRSFGSVDGGALSVMLSMEASSRSVFVAVNSRS
jgi:hypothetical protein